MSCTETPFILAIESSCDDTSAAVLQGTEVRSNCIATQELHAQFGGVVPELASRAHQQHIVRVVQYALDKANIAKNDLSAIAFTKGPGLLGSLLVGVSFAKSMAHALNIPLIEVNHMQAHILAHFIKDAHVAPPDFPFLALTVSGGHTQIVQVNAFDSFVLLGQTLDDAVGECFDKSAKVLGYSYPGGPHIDRLAQSGDPNAFELSVPTVPELNFSYSGLKTQFSKLVQSHAQSDEQFITKRKNDLAATLQQTIVTSLLNKVLEAMKQTGIRQLTLGGGVAANSGLRKALENAAIEKNFKVFIPELRYCTDNAAMIGITAYFKYLKGSFSDLSVQAQARYSVHS